MQQLSRHFKRSEFTCHCGCGFDVVDAELLHILQMMRFYFNQPIKILSGARCKMHNSLVGGKPNSLHMIGKAADIQIKNIPPARVASFLEWAYPSCYGIGRYPDFTHIDVRPSPARWG